MSSPTMSSFSKSAGLVTALAAASVVYSSDSACRSGRWQSSSSSRLPDSVSPCPECVVAQHRRSGLKRNSFRRVRLSILVPRLKGELLRWTPVLRERSSAHPSPMMRFQMLWWPPYHLSHYHPFRPVQCRCLLGVCRMAGRWINGWLMVTSGTNRMSDSLSRTSTSSDLIRECGPLRL